MDANDIQIGGDHYKRQGELQHWDVCANVGAMEYAATKYLSRWPHKGKALEDLRKAQHYTDKLIEQAKEGVRPMAKDEVATEVIERFNEACGMDRLTLAAFSVLCQWNTNVQALVACRQIIGLIIKGEEAKQEL